MKNINNESGRSMIEMLGVLAIIGVLSVGGIAGYSKAMNKYRINKAIEQITLIAGNVRTFFASQGNYSGLKCSDCGGGEQGCNGINMVDGCPIIRKSKILPDEMITLNSTGTKITKITNAFENPLYLYYASKVESGDKRAFSFFYYLGDNTEACIELLTHDWTVANVKAIALYDSVTTLYFKIPVSIDLAVEKCSNAEKSLYFPRIDILFDLDLNSTFWKNKTWQN